MNFWEFDERLVYPQRYIAEGLGKMKLNFCCGFSSKVKAVDNVLQAFKFSKGKGYTYEYVQINLYR